MIILSKEETSKKVKKLEEKVVKLFNQFGLTPQGGAATEISFLVDIEKEKDYKTIIKKLEEYAEKAGYEVEVIED